MNEHRQKIEALLETFIGWGRQSGNELGKDYHQGRSMAFYACADELEAILSDWPEEPAKKDVEDIAPKLVRIALCTTTGSGNAYYALIPETKRHAIEAIVYAMREEGL